MSPIERRIVHLALQDDEAVTTESRGDGFYKRVAVIPRPPAVES
jgi:spoIIIJ-associated protein